MTSGKSTATLPGLTNAIMALAFSPDGKTLAASGVGDKMLQLWDLPTGKEYTHFRLPRLWSSCVAFSSDGNTIALVQQGVRANVAIQLWNVVSGKEKASLRGHTRRIWSVAFSPDGTALASGSSDNTVRLWDLSTSKERASLQGHTADVTSVAYSPDGKLLASGSYDGTVKLWNLPSAKSAGK